MAAERVVQIVGTPPGPLLGRGMRALLLLLWLAARGDALYFHIGETEKKCFIEEIPDETMVIGAGAKGRVWDESVVIGAEGCDPSRVLSAANPAPTSSSSFPLPFSAHLQEITGRSCMTNSGRSTSQPLLGLACS